MKKTALLSLIFLATGLSAHATCYQEFVQMNENPMTLGEYAKVAVGQNTLLTLLGPFSVFLPHATDAVEIYTSQKRIQHLVTLMDENDACKGKNITALYQKYKKGSTFYQRFYVSHPGRLSQSQFCDMIYKGDQDLSLCGVSRIPSDSFIINIVEGHSQE